MENCTDPVSPESRKVSVEEILTSECGGLYEYWNNLRGERFAPRWDEFRLVDLPVALIPNVYVADVLGDPFDAAVRFWGSGLTEVFKCGHTDETFSVMTLGTTDEARRHRVLEDFRCVVETKAPFPFCWDMRLVGRRDTGAPALRVPISDDGKTVTKIVCGFDFSENRDEWLGCFTSN